MAMYGPIVSLINKSGGFKDRRKQARAAKKEAEAEDDDDDDEDDEAGSHSDADSVVAAKDGETAEKHQEKHEEKHEEYEDGNEYEECEKEGSGYEGAGECQKL